MANDYPLSVVIPVSDDVRIGECLASLPEGIEIIVVLNNNPSQEVKRIVELDYRCHPVFVEGVGCNLARIFNIGIASARSDCVMLLNSDCVVPDGLVSAIVGGLDRFDVVKARVSFSFDHYSTKLVAKVRWLHHHVFRDGKNLYGPGLAFHKSIAGRIGGYYFNQDMGWGEDGELSIRILGSGVSICYLEQEVIHGRETVHHDLRVAFRIGSGDRRYDQSNGVLLGSALLRDLTNTLFDRRGRFRLAIKKAGILSAVYFVVWKVANRIGYYAGRK